MVYSISSLFCRAFCYFVVVFFSPLALRLPHLGKRELIFSAFRTFVQFVLAWLCLFSLPRGVWEGLWLVIVALPGLFSYLFSKSFKSVSTCT